MKTNYFIRTGAAMLLAALCFAHTACSECDCDRPKEPAPQVEPPEGYGSQQAIAGFKKYFYENGEVYANRLVTYAPTEWSLATEEAQKPLDIFKSITGIPVVMQDKYASVYLSKDGKCRIRIAGTANADAKAIFATMTVEIAECPEIETMHIVAPGYFYGDTSDEMELGVPVIYAK